jgi:hypothetical protein
MDEVVLHFLLSYSSRLRDVRWSLVPMKSSTEFLLIIFVTALLAIAIPLLLYFLILRLGVSP